MSGDISGELENSDLSSLIAHLSSLSSQMVDKEYRDILENLFQKSKNIPAGIYTLHGLTIAGGEYSSEARIVFKYPDNNKKGVYHDHLLSKRGIDFDFLDDNNQVVSSGSETKSNGSPYGSGEFSSTYFNGPTYNPTGNIKKIKFFKKTSVSTWMSVSEIESSFDDPSDDLPRTESSTSTTSDDVYSGSDTRYWYDLDLTSSNIFTIDYNPASSDCLINLSLNNASSFYKYSEPNVTGTGNMSWGFNDISSSSTIYGNRSLNSGPYFSHNIKLFIRKTGSTTCSSLAQIDRVKLKFSDTTVDLKLNSQMVLKFNSQDSVGDVCPVNLKLIRCQKGWYCTMHHDFNSSIITAIDEFSIVTKNTCSNFFMNISNSSPVVIDWGDGTTHTVDENSYRASVSHSYSSSGSYNIKITGIGLNSLYFYRNPNGYYSSNAGATNLESVKITGMKNLSLAFLFASSDIRSIDLTEYVGRPPSLGSFASEAVNLHTITGLDRLDVTFLNSMDFAFNRCYSLANTVGLKDWKPTKLTEAMNAFYKFGSQISSSDDNYNLDLSNWALPLISSQPSNFSADSTISTLPVWGG